MGKIKKNGSGMIRRFIGNRNTVTILGFLACVAVLVIGYNYRVKEAISPITVPYAKQDIPSRTLITSDMIGRIRISSEYVNNADNLIKQPTEVVGKYVSFKTSISKGSLFYKESLKEADEMPDAAFANIESKHTIYSLSVNADTTFYNQIRAGDYIDLYMSAVDKENNNLVMYGRLIESIRVLAVKDSKGNNIIKNSIAYGKPSELLFSVSDEMFLLLKEAEYVDGDIEITPVVRNEKYTADAGDTVVSSEQLRQFIESKVMVMQ